jgi:hypothetical protein
VRILSLGRLVADALVDFTNFDSRIWRSLVTLTFKPGRLTSAYVAGQRARYAPPFRMYVVTSVAFFVAFSLTRLLSSPPNEPVEGAQIEASVNATVDAALAEAGLAPQRLGPPGRAVPDAPEPDAATVNPDYFNLSRDDDGSWECDFDQKMEPQMRARLEAACRKIENDSGASFVRAFADNFPVMMLVFIPLVAAIMKVLYLFARRKYVEHLLFFLHVHTFFFLTALVWILFGRGAALMPWLEWPARIVGLVVWIYFPIYLYLAMRRFYAQGHALTSIKYVVLGGSYVFAFVLTLIGLVVYTAATL